MRSVVVPAISLALAGLLAACSSSSSSTANSSGSAAVSSAAAATSAPASVAGSPSAPPSAPSSAPATGSATAQIKSNWESFFGGSTTAAQKVALLQNGPHFSATITAQQSLFQSVSAQVSDVVVSGNTAKVTYTLSFGGKPVLSGQEGTAILDGGVWKVGDASLCSLLALENGGKSPAVCASA